jgi:hypothetical protein
VLIAVDPDRRDEVRAQLKQMPEVLGVTSSERVIRTYREQTGETMLFFTTVRAWIPSPLVVDTAAVTRGPLEVEIAEDARTRVRECFVVTAPITGQLERVELEAGAAVAEGSVLARIRRPRSRCSTNDRGRGRGAPGRRERGRAPGPDRDRSRADRPRRGSPRGRSHAAPRATSGDPGVRARARRTRRAARDRGSRGRRAAARLGEGPRSRPRGRRFTQRQIRVRPGASRSSRPSRARCCACSATARGSSPPVRRCSSSAICARSRS